MNNSGMKKLDLGLKTDIKGKMFLGSYALY